MGIRGGCEDPECCCSSDMSGEMTFGKGELSYYGYWEFPCTVCDKAWYESGRAAELRSILKHMHAREQLEWMWESAIMRLKEGNA